MTQINDAASSNGVWSDGTPWHMQRTNTGEYTVNFERFYWTYGFWSTFL
jgi:hypothetical protein